MVSMSPRTSLASLRDSADQRVVGPPRRSTASDRRLGSVSITERMRSSGATVGAVVGCSPPSSRYISTPSA